MAWLIGTRLGNKPGVLWSLKDRHTLKAESKRKNILEHGEKSKFKYGHGINECILQNGGL